MQIKLNENNLREILLMALGSKYPTPESKVLKDIANLRERIVDSKADTFEISDLEYKYCVNAIVLTTLSSDEKFKILGAFGDGTN